MRIYLSAAFVMILIMGWGVYLKETYVPPDFQANPDESQVVQATPSSTPTPNVPSDTQAPTQPMNILATAIAQNQISLTWTGSNDNTDIAGYRILQDGQEIGTTAHTFFYIDIPLSSTATHSYAVIAYDSAGNSSPSTTINVRADSLINNRTSTNPSKPVATPTQKITPRPTSRPTIIPTPSATATPQAPAEIASVITDAAGAAVTVTGIPIAIRYSTNLVSNLPVTLANGRHAIVWPLGTSFVCYQARGSDGIWTASHCNNVSPATYSAEVAGVVADANGANVSVNGSPVAVRYSTNLVSNLPVTLTNGRHTIVWPQGTTFACYQAQGTSGIWTSIYCNNVTPSTNAPTATPPAAATPTPTQTPTSTHTPTPSPTPNANPTPTPTSTPTAIPTAIPSPTPTPAPTSSFSGSPASIISGQSSTLSWSSSNATSCTASGGWSGAKATSGSQSVSPTSNTTYTLACTGGGGTVTKNVSIAVSAPTPTPTPTPPASSCGSGGACTAADVALHSTRANCWVYLRSPYNKTYNITNYVANGSSSHPGGDVIVSHCGGDIYDFFIGNAGGHRHSNSAINTILQAYYIGPFQ